MKIKLQEVELGTANPDISKGFYQSILGLQTTVDEENLKVFSAGIEKFDFNISTHFPPGAVAISFITDNLQEVMTRLSAAGVHFDGPKPSHLRMETISFRDTDGYTIKVNEAGSDSPAWLKEW